MVRESVLIQNFILEPDISHLLARSALLAWLRDEISPLVHGNLAVVTRARCGGADFDGAAGELVGDACVDAGLRGWEVLVER